MFLSQCGPPSGTSSLPGQTPSEPLGSRSFTFSKTLLQWGEAPRVTHQSSLKGESSWWGCVPCPCFLHSSLPTTEFLTLSGPAFFIFLPFPALLLSHFEGLPQPRASCAGSGLSLCPCGLGKEPLPDSLSTASFAASLSNTWELE